MKEIQVNKDEVSSDKDNDIDELLKNNNIIKNNINNDDNDDNDDTI